MRKTVHVVTAIYAFIYAAAMLAVAATCIAYLAPNSTQLTAYFAKITATPQILSLAETDYTTFLTVYIAAVTLCAAVPALTAVFCAAALLRRDKRALKIVSTVIFLCAGTLSAAYMATCAGASFDVTVPAVTESILAVSLITPLLCTLSIAYCTPAAQRTLPAAVQKTESREAYGAEERETSEERAGALAAEQSVDQQPSAEECTAAQMEEQCEPNAAERQDFAEQQAAEQQTEAMDITAEKATTEACDQKSEEQTEPSAEGTDGEVAPEQALQTEATIKDTATEEPQEEQAATEDTEQPEEQAATQAPQKNAEQPTWREVSQYVPQDQTVEGIAEEAYGSVQPISEATLKKIETLRLLLESKAITSDEYVRLVRSYIDAK